MQVDHKEVSRRLEQFKGVAKEAGIKLTHQRLEIFRAVASSLEHPNAEIVHRSVQTATPTVSLDTVYRTLWLLTDLGLLTTLGPRQDSVRFDAKVDHHHHYVCTRCGLTRDIEGSELDGLEVPESVGHLGKVTSAHVELRGICERCVQHAPANPQTNEPATTTRNLR